MTKLFQSASCHHSVDFYHKHVETAEEFRQFIDLLSTECLVLHKVPIICLNLRPHSEDNGDITGVKFHKDDSLSWNKLMALLQDVNASTNNRLTIISSVHSTSSSFYASMNQKDEPPYWIYISPGVEELPGVLIPDQLECFFKYFLASGSVEEAYEETLALPRHYSDGTVCDQPEFWTMITIEPATP